MKFIVAAAAALVLAPAALAGPNVRIGVVDDAPIWNDAGAQVDLAKAAGFDSIRITAQWSTGMTAMSPGQTSRLQRAALFASMRGLSPIVSIYNASGAMAPNSPDARAQFVEFAKSAVRDLPWSTTFIVGNEANSSVYWQPQFDGSTIAEGDYAKLVALLGKAFDGTAQRGSRLPIFYGEYGVETTVPASRAGMYGGSESAKTVDEATQAAFYAEAFRLALCQPNVIGIMVFHTIDESALGAWQSGPYYADGTPKSSLPAIRNAANAARAGSAASCPDRTAPAVSISTADGIVTAAAADAVGVGKVMLRVNGVTADTRFAGPYTFSWRPKRVGRYTLEVRAFDATGNVGRKLLVVSAKRGDRIDASTPARWVLTAVRAATASPTKARRPRG